MARRTFTLDEFAEMHNTSTPTIAPVAGMQQRDFGAIARGGTDTSIRDLPGNVLPSAGRAISDIFSAVTNPVQTGKALGNLAIGAGAKIQDTLSRGVDAVFGTKGFGRNENQEAQDMVDAVTRFYTERYGSLENARQTFINDPVGALSDVAAVLSVGGLAARGAGGAVQAAGATRTGETLSRAGQALTIAGNVADPIVQAGRGVGAVAAPVTRAIGNAGAEVLGATTGAKSGVIREAFRNDTPEYQAALRGDITEGDIVGTARDALQVVRNERAAAYQQAFSKLQAAKETYDISPVVRQLDKELDNFGIRRAQDGTLDFSRSTISNRSDQNDVAALLETVNEWGYQAGDRTGVGIDLLKRRMDDFYSDSGQARALVASVKGEVQKVLDKIPGYRDMTKAYRESSELIEDLQKALSLGTKASDDTAIRKLTSIMRDNNEVRLALVRDLERISGANISGMVAGQQLNRWMPRGLMQVLLPGAAVGQLALGSIGWGILPTLAVTSPKTVATFLKGLGMSTDVADKMTRIMAEMYELGILQPVLSGARQMGASGEMVDASPDSAQGSQTDVLEVQDYQIPTEDLLPDWQVSR